LTQKLIKIAFVRILGQN